MIRDFLASIDSNLCFSLIEGEESELLFNRKRAIEEVGKCLGFANLDVTRGPNGEPIWSQNIKGSISHSQGDVIVVASSRNDVSSIGIDIEKLNRDIPLKISKRICTENEKKWLIQLPQSEQKKFLTALFSAKEALYKACFPLHKKFFGFKEADLIWDESRQEFIGRLMFENDLQCEEFLIKVLFNEVFVFTILVLEKP